MAVTIVESPILSPEVISGSYPVLFKVASDVYGTAGVTQFRFVAEIETTTEVIATKFTVVSEDPNFGYFDVSNTLRAIMELHSQALIGGPITQITTVSRQGDYPKRAYYIDIKERYYLNGVFTENLAPRAFLVVARGYSADPDQIWSIVNWNMFNGLRDYIPYSGNRHIVYPVPTDGEGWDQDKDYMHVQVIPSQSGTPFVDVWFNRTDIEYSGVVYVPIYWPGVTDQPEMDWIAIIISLSDTDGSGGVVQDTIYIDKTVEECEDPEHVIMFQDRFFQWSFMSFTKKYYQTISTSPQRAEGVKGRYRYNVDSSDTIRLNTDWVSESLNEMFRDLVQTPQCYLVGDDGSLEMVTVVPNSLALKTSRNEGLIQYSMSFRKSVDNFKP